MRSYFDVETQIGQKNYNKLRPQSCNSPWPNQKPNKVDLWILILRNHYLVTDPSSWWSEKKIRINKHLFSTTREKVKS